MTRVYLADAQLEERYAIRLLLDDLQLEVVGEAADWHTTLAQAPASGLDMLLVDSKLLPKESCKALAELRGFCKNTIVVVLLSPLDARQQAALSAGVDMFISKLESPEQIEEHLRTLAGSIRV